jgi:hypothetical protein
MNKKILMNEFVRYFIKFPNHSYKQFHLYLTNNSFIPFGVSFNQTIDSIRKTLQNNKILQCSKKNDGNGYFYSEKKIDIQKYNSFINKA